MAGTAARLPRPCFARRCACARDRIRIPGGELAAAFHRRRERGLRRAPHRRLGARTGRAARPGRALCEGGQSAGGALGRGGSAGRDRARACPAAGAAALRRADWAPRLGHGRAGARLDRGAAAGTRLCPRRRDPRPRRRRAAAAGGRIRGWRHRRRGDGMRIAVPLALAELVRGPGRTLLRVLTLATAVGLLGAMVLFVGHSLGAMTGSAVRSVPLDWQGPVGSYAAARRVARGVARQAGVAEAVPTATAPFAGL